jgi:hypothetical protein
MALTKHDIVEQIQALLGFPKNKSVEIVESLFEIIKSTLSSGDDGLFIRTTRKISNGQPIKLEFPLFRFDNTVQVSGKVVRIDSDGFAVAFDKRLDALESKDGQLPEIVHEIDR